MPKSEAAVESRRGAPPPLEVRMSVKPDDGCACGERDVDGSDIRQSMTMCDDGTWSCELVLENGGGSEYHRNPACESCPCYLFATQECVAEVVDIRDGRIHYSVTIPDRSALAPMVERLRDAGATVSVYRILTADDGENDGPTLTDKQRETLELAIERGYFDRPRGATLEDIADELDVTISAVSQRLSAVNRRLIHRYAEDAWIDKPE
jgi:hypothetical protein